MKLFLLESVVLAFVVLVLLELTALTFGSAVLLGLDLVLVLLFAVADVFRVLAFRFLVSALDFALVPPEDEDGFLL